MKNKKAQLKIQEMAFVLIAIMIFFALVGLFYLTIRLSTLKEDVSLQRGDEAKELVRKLADSPEFSWTSSQCSGCVDLDKAMLLKERKSYQGFWNIDYLKIQFIYPNNEGECTRANYPNCSTITIASKTKEFGITESSFVSLCRQEFKESGYKKCALGKIYASAKEVK